MACILILKGGEPVAISKRSAFQRRCRVSHDESGSYRATARDCPYGARKRNEDTATITSIGWAAGRYYLDSPPFSRPAHSLRSWKQSI